MQVVLRVRRRHRFRNWPPDLVKKFANTTVVMLAAAFIVIVLLGERHWNAMEKAQLSNVTQSAVLSVAAGMNKTNHSFSSTIKQAPITDETKKAVRILQNAGMIKSADYWMGNARQTQTVKGEYAAILLQRAAQKSQHK